MIVNQFFKEFSFTSGWLHHHFIFSPSTTHFTTLLTSQSDSRCQMDNGHYFMLIVGITKINGFCSTPEMIQLIIHLNSKFRSSISLEIADKNGQFQTTFLDLNLVEKRN